MAESLPPMNDPQVAARRKSARRTALIVAAVAVAVYVAFMLSGVFKA
ncbi:hypothetical protein LVB87_05510 [Lysobacter sp. KIS68-7]|nr:hypothetical protein [Lysobacter sp. KIS68-7]UHQ20601.1 hypothetical protein LVB87_05510 [Lysobacter sp. KIS68-7]